MIAGKIIRNIYTSNILWESSSKQLLAKLRKKTGYAFANCKKALELNENDLDKAELWLDKQAQSLGWAKAEKLQNRVASQGLITAIIDQQRAALIEINCETDFVAKNEKFHGLAEIVANAVLNHTKTQSISKSLVDGCLRMNLDSEMIKSLPCTDGKSIADHTALAIGSVGENIIMKRALCFGVAPDVKLVGCTHPTPVNTLPISVGRYGVLLAYKSEDNNEQLGHQLCQHIIGMSPTKIGNPNVDEPNPNDDEEDVLIFQEFLLDPNVTVQQLLTDSNAEVISFARFEVGEVEKTKIDEIETGG